MSATNITCMQFDPASPVSGVLVSDTDGALTNLMVKGCTFGLSFKNVLDDLKITRYRFDAVRSYAPGAVLPLYFDYDATSNRGPRLYGVHCTNAFSFCDFSPAFVYDPHLVMYDVLNDEGTWDYVTLANNQSGTPFNVGDIVELDSAHAGTDRRVITPNVAGADYAGRLAVVVSGLPNDDGNGFMLVAPLPQNRASVKASAGAIAYGDRIGYVATRRAQTSVGAAQPLGKALERKAAGAEGMIVIGSAA
jgi:hypothetical protein